MALYRDPRDKRVFVPKPGGGVVLNFGHPIAWAILLCTTIVPFVIVTVVTVAVLL
ncbi:peptide ABC transporter substrate-binding protein [Actinoplanes sp. NEAU-A12]|uniref:Peptide ABC transporter substrate-binding protein n=1 Tax=Actinoplanes sandaracinus TaxID=3045177 RepID=A0ABT6WEC2_9ACTN|nr:peptide ABC transporter substrate-binding protein [Actinoplanes sandaracinus]MDI6098043.1 peptide ABC transporter substrate-binding protein [Actinoplanes sandaracinus]